LRNHAGLEHADDLIREFKDGFERLGDLQRQTG
jgi:hypothetical protein